VNALRDTHTHNHIVDKAISRTSYASAFGWHYWFKTKQISELKNNRD